MADEGNIKRMADLLKSGATMLGYHCPECNSPLFSVRGEIWCPRCNKQVITAKDGDGLLEKASLSLNDVESMVLIKIQETSKTIMEEKDPEAQERLCHVLLKWLEALEKTRRIQKM